MNRRGFALLAVLWLLTVLSAVALAGTLAARESVAAASFRVGSMRAAWVAEACAERARAAVDRFLADSGSWQDLEQKSVLPSLARFGCTARLLPAGWALDVNRAGLDQLLGLFGALGLRGGAADSLAHAILDWRDADHLERPGGAEATWYRRSRRPLPRNGPFAASEELRLVRGAGELPGLDTLLSAEPGRTPINLAPPAVLAALPGLGPEILHRIDQRRRSDRPFQELSQLVDGVSASARNAFMRRYAELGEAATVNPEAWILTVWAGSATLELRFASAGASAGIVRRRTW